MTLTVGLLAQRPAVVAGRLLDSARVVNFSFSPDRLGPLLLIESAFAVPGRYLAEMARRLVRHARPEGGLLLLNPRFDLSAFGVEAALDTTREVAKNDFSVLSDRRGRTVGIYCREPVDEADVKLLGALSLIDPELDRRLLQSAFGVPVAVREVTPLDAGNAFANGFIQGSFDESAMRLPATLAIEALDGATASGSTPAQARRTLKTIPVLPYHAGDIVFLCQGLQALPEAGAVVTLREFAPIVQELLPFTRLVAVEGTPQNRNGFVVPSEQAHLVAIIKRARADEAAAGRRLDGLFLLLRPQRDHARSHFHLRQQLWFALGASCETEAEPFPSARHQKRHRRSTPERRSRVAIHFDGGWDLKSYPRPFRQPLIDLLIANGFSPVVIGKPDPALDGCAFEPFRGLAGFRSVVEGSAAVLGCDSFPAHYAVNFGVPTLHLFGSTSPRNSGETDSPLSRVLHHDLPCVPCGQPDLCNLDRGHSCRANPTPHEVLAALLALIGPPAPAPVASEGASEERQLAIAVEEAERALPARPASMAERYRADYLGALRRLWTVKSLGLSGRALDVDASQGAVARRLLEAGFAAAALQPGGDAVAARRLSGVRVEASLPGDETWDVITAFAAETVPGLALLLPALARALAPAGTLVVEVPAPALPSLRAALEQAGLRAATVDAALTPRGRAALAAGKEAR